MLADIDLEYFEYLFELNSGRWILMVWVSNIKLNRNICIICTYHYKQKNIYKYNMLTKDISIMK